MWLGSQKFGNLEKRPEVPLPSSTITFFSFYFSKMDVKLVQENVVERLPKYLTFHGRLGVVVIDCSCRILIDIATQTMAIKRGPLGASVFLDDFQKVVIAKSGH